LANLSFVTGQSVQFVERVSEKMKRIYNDILCVNLWMLPIHCSKGFRKKKGNGSFPDTCFPWEN